jgi:hypothetical protein
LEEGGCGKKTRDSAMRVAAEIKININQVNQLINCNVVENVVEFQVEIDTKEMSKRISASA